MTAEQRIKTGVRGLENIGFRLLSFETHSDPEANARAIATLLGKAEKSIFILTDHLNYSYQNGAVQNSIAKALERGVKIHVACGPKPETESIDILKALVQQSKTDGKITLYTLKQSPALHFEVVDRKHVRIEKPHPPGETGTCSVIRLNQEGLARELENVFTECIFKAVAHKVLGEQ